MMQTKGFGDAGWASLTGAYASGTDRAAGGRTRYNELGVEGYVPPGAQIIPNAVLRGLATIAPDRMRAAGGGDVHVTFAPVYQVAGYGQDIANLQVQMARHEAAFDQKVVTAVRKAQRATH